MEGPHPLRGEVSDPKTADGGSCAPRPGRDWVLLAGRLHAAPALPGPQRPPAEDVDRSERVRLLLEELHRVYHFGLIEFAEWGGLGFRAIQARRAGVAFHDVPLLVKLHSSTQWMREGNCQWIKDKNELQLDYCERYSFENADVQASPTQYMLDYARGVGWAMRPDARVTPYPTPCRLQMTGTLQSQ